MQKGIIKKILSETESGYDLVAGKFSETRKRFWSNFEFIGEYVKNQDRVLDFGCGNGRLLEIFKDKNIKYFGVDVSQKLIEVAQEKYGALGKFQKIDPQSAVLDFSNNHFNVVFSIAVFHHLPREHAQKIAHELQRITKPGGHVVVTVWYLWSRKHFKNILKNWKNKILGKSSLNWNDCYISFKNNEGQVFERYHHTWTQSELKNIFEESGFQKISCKKVGRNLVYIGKK